MKIIIETIAHNQQPYDCVGDYWIEPSGTWQIRVSDLGDWRLEVAIAVHELSELAQMVHKGITVKDVVEFDKLFEAERQAGKHTAKAEPGDDPRAQYRPQHFVATTVERILCKELDVDWDEYAKKVESLVYEPAHTRTDIRAGDIVQEANGMMRWTVWAIDEHGRAMMYSQEGNVSIKHVHWLKKVS